ncbi:hypothetical protein ACFLXO_05865 [Chloroflexota bacterium]
MKPQGWNWKASLSDRRVELADLGLVTEYVEDLSNVLIYISLAEQRSFIYNFVKEVKVAGTDALLTYTMPLSPQGIIREWAGVLNTVHYSGAEVSIGRTFFTTFTLVCRIC